MAADLAASGGREPGGGEAEGAVVVNEEGLLGSSVSGRMYAWACLDAWTLHEGTQSMPCHCTSKAVVQPQAPKTGMASTGERELPGGGDAGKGHVAGGIGYNCFLCTLFGREPPQQRWGPGHPPPTRLAVRWWRKVLDLPAPAPRHGAGGS